MFLYFCLYQSLCQTCKSYNCENFLCCSYRVCPLMCGSIRFRTLFSFCLPKDHETHQYLPPASCSSGRLPCFEPAFPVKIHSRVGKLHLGKHFFLLFPLFLYALVSLIAHPGKSNPLFNNNYKICFAEPVITNRTQVPTLTWAAAINQFCTYRCSPPVDGTKVGSAGV